MKDNEYITISEAMKEPDYLRTFLLGSWEPTCPELSALAEMSCARYDSRCELSETPGAPHISRRGMPTYQQIKHEEINSTYDRARFLGFEGERHEWAHFCYDQRPPEPRRERA